MEFENLGNPQDPKYSHELTMIKTALLIHGAFGTSSDNWFPWLKTELENLGYKVLIPQFPTPENQNLTAWEAVILPYLGYLNQDSIIVGHSLGVPFGLRVLEMLDEPIKAFYGASGFIELLNNPTFDAINYTFTQRDFAWSKINNKAENFYFYQGDNDPYVPMICAENLSKKTKTQLQIIHGGGHLNQDAKFVKLPQLLDNIKDIS